MLQKRIVLILAFSLTACASKGQFIDREALSKEMNVTKAVYNDRDIRELYRKKANLPKPFKLAIYFKPAKIEEWRWTEEDKNLILAVTQDLRGKGIIADAFPILSSMVNDPDSLKDIRLAAAQYHADALLIVSGAGEVRRSLNPLGITYILLLPTAFMPGSQADTLFLANAAMYDVRNEYLYLTAESEGSGRKRYPALIGAEDRDLLMTSKHEALAHLSDELKTLVGSKL